MKQFDAVVLSAKEITTAISLVWLAVPPEGAAGRPGQYYMVRCSEHYDPLLRRPIAFHRARQIGPVSSAVADLAQGSVNDLLPGGHIPSDLDPRRLPSPFAALALLVHRVGRGSRWLAARQPGDVIDLLGPLGSGYVVQPGSRNLLLIAGGMGAAPLVALSEEAIGRGLAVTLLLGASSAAQAYPSHLLPPEVELVLTTEDGSAGIKGRVTDVMADYLPWADQVFACGPEPMYEAIHSLVKRLGTSKSVQVSLEKPMACGVGACRGCSFDSKLGRKTVSKDGPVFEMEELIW